MAYSQLLHAIDFAAVKHRNQRRKSADQAPYINHPIRVARLIAEIGHVEDVEILVAAVLHDTVEDTDTTPEEIETRFGVRVRGMVAEVTDDKSLPKDERKQRQIDHAPHLSPGAAVIKLADKIANVSDIAHSPPADWTEQRVREYVEWGERVVRNIPRVNPPLEIEFGRIAEAIRKRLGIDGEATR